MNRKTKTTSTKDEARPTLVPKLRFPEFREAEGWESRKVDDIVDTVTPPKKLPTASYASSGEFPIIDQSQSDISGWTNDNEALIREGLPLIVFGDHTCILKLISRPFAQGADGIKILNSRPKIGTPFLFQLLSHRPVATEEYRRHYSILKERIVFFPEFKSGEQQKIVECLSSVDELMAAQARKVDALKTHKKGLMQQLFPREGETVPRLRFPEFRNAGEWEESPLSNFILSLDAGVSVNAGDRPANKTEFGVLKTSAVTNGIFAPEENKVVLAESEQSRLKEPVSGGTIIICRKNTPALVGANVYVESRHENLFLPDLLWAAKPRAGVSMRFLAFVLGSEKGRAALSKLASGSSVSMSNITKPDVLAFSVMAPSPAEQQRIAECLTTLDALIAAETQKLEALKTHKKGLMQQLFPSPEEASDL